MKRLWIILIVLLLSVSLFGCGQKQIVYMVTMDGTEFAVDSAEKTISDGEYTYHYRASGDASSFSVTITYPNGSSYWTDQKNGMIMSGWSDDYADDAYVPGDTLVDVVQYRAPRQVNWDHILGGFVLIGLGIFDVAVPKASWYLGYGWRFKDAEPSDAALVYARIGGGVAIAVGLILLLM